MKLTDAAMKKVAFQGKVKKITDGNGLYAKITASGKYWRFDYRYAEKRKTLSLGTYPHVSLKDARLALYAAKEQLDKGIDPNYVKKRKLYSTADDSFRAFAAQWINRHDVTDKTRDDIRQKFEKDVYPVLGDTPIPLINSQDILDILHRIESRDALDLARRVCTNISQVMDQALVVQLITINPCNGLRGAIKKKRKTKQYPAIVHPEQFGQLLRDMDTYGLNAVIASALRLFPYVALRPTELRAGAWSEINWEARLWVIPGWRMKKDREHIVPLSDQAFDQLRALQKITGKNTLMFPSPVRSKADQPISENTVNQALNRLGYAGLHCPHGFRSTFSTTINTQQAFPSEVVEAQLSHLDPDRVRGAYNRADHLAARIQMMQWWADQVDAMRQLPPAP